MEGGAAGTRIWKKNKSQHLRRFMDSGLGIEMGKEVGQEDTTCCSDACQPVVGGAGQGWGSLPCSLVYLLWGGLCASSRDQSSLSVFREDVYDYSWILSHCKRARGSQGTGPPPSLVS